MESGEVIMAIPGSQDEGFIGQNDGSNYTADFLRWHYRWCYGYSVYEESGKLRDGE